MMELHPECYAMKPVAVLTTLEVVLEGYVVIPVVLRLEVPPEGCEVILAVLVILEIHP